MSHDLEWYYLDGQAFAAEVQQGLREGKSFDDLTAFPPDRAAHIRDLWLKKTDPQSQEMYQWWKGYVSRWD